ncbi:MAG: alpha/beta hydrolase [Pseudorhodoplanes sp.]
MKIRDVEFLSEGDLLRGQLLEPEGRSARTPAVIMAPGFGASVNHSPIRYANAFVAGGLTVLVYDHPCFGKSEGLPRQDVDPVRQRRAFRDAITFAQRQPRLDPDRIGLWGSSYAGGHVLEVAALDRRVKCVVSQVPTISGFAQSRRRMNTDAIRAMRERFDADRSRRMDGNPPATMPIVSVDPAKPGYFNSQRAYDNYMVEGFCNEITVRSIELAWENEPAIHVGRISPTPLLMIVADEDEATPTDLALQAYAQALEPKQLLLVKGGHFTPYWEHFEKTSGAAIDWFVMHLGS